MSSTVPLLSVRSLKVQHVLPRPWPWSPVLRLRAVDDVHFNLRAGETLGIVGESGCGKSTLARALVGLVPATSGGIVYGGQDLTRLTREQWRPLRRDIQMVFQDPTASLNPRMTIGESIAEPLRALMPELDTAERARRVAAMLERVGLSPTQINRFPHEFSGGQCQRAVIARALIVNPKILICDEPVTALDVSVQAQIVNLLRDLQRDSGLAMIFIAHDLAVVRQISHRVLVMYLGKLVEQAARDELFDSPRHPYTKALLEAAAAHEPDAEGQPHKPLVGELPSALEPPSGCVFRTRCPIADDPCLREVPHLRRMGATHFAACHFLDNTHLSAAHAFKAI